MIRMLDKDTISRKKKDIVLDGCEVECMLCTKNENTNPELERKKRCSTFTSCTYTHKKN